MATPRTRFRHARLYITFRCNARCGYCNVWQDPVFDGHQELTADGLRRCLDELAELGVTYVDITGGEPGLHRELTAAVRHAKEIGLTVDLTTNAIRFAKQAADIVPLVDTMNISMDTLSAERYHAIRGTDTLHRTTSLLETLRTQGADNVKLICVVSGQNIDELADMVGFAQQQEVPLYLSPMFSYFSGQSEVRPAGRTARSLRLVSVNGNVAPPVEPAAPGVPPEELLRQVGDQLYEPQTIVSLPFLRHLRLLDPTTETSCGANSRILTIGPDGRVMLPCYHEWDGSMEWERPYRELVADPALTRVVEEEVGKRPGCRRCAVFPYLGLAMSYQLTAPFLVQAFSEELHKIKRYAGASSAELREGLLRRSNVLLAELETRSARLRPGSHLDELYHFEVVDGRVRTDFAAEPITVEELLADHAYEDCWRSQRTPHRLIRLLYAEILPALRAAGTEELLADALDVHLDCWELLLGLLPGDESSPVEAADRLGRWCDRAAHAISTDTSALAVLAAFSSLPVERIRSWGALAGHPEEALAVKLLLATRTASRRRELAELVSAELRPALAGTLPSIVDSAGSVPSPESARRGEGLGRFVADLRRADTDRLREAVRRWKACADPATAAEIEQRLLRFELVA